MSVVTLPRSISLTGAVSLLVGYVVGASIFILPGSLGAETGPGLFLSYMIAAIPALLACFVTAQVGSALPVSGANFVVVNRALSKRMGFMFVWCIIASLIVGIPLAAYGFSEYLSYFFPEVSLSWTSTALIIFFMVANILGISIANKVQMLLVVEFIVALIVFIIGGIINSDPINITPLLPNGISPMLIMAIPAYFSYTGFLVIAGLGDEIKNPSKNIPRAIWISFSIVLLVYIGVAIALLSTLSWQNLAETQAPVAVAAQIFMPKWVADIIAVSALFAAATSINGILMAQSRDFYAIGKEGGLFTYFTKLHMKYRTPARAIIFVGALGILGVALGRGIKDYAIIAVIGFMILHVFTGLSAFLMPRKLTKEYLSAEYKLPPLTLYIISLSLVVVSILFIIIGVIESPISAFLFFAFMILGLIVSQFNGVEKNVNMIKPISYLMSKYNQKA
jgi:APA family basic amino acid/polyamine antiporter